MAFLSIVEGDHRDADQPARRHFAVIDQPIVGDLKAGLLHVRHLPKQTSRKPESRVKHLGADPVDFHLVQAVLWDPIRPVSRPACCAEEIWGISLLGNGRQIFFPEIHRLHDM